MMTPWYGNDFCITDVLSPVDCHHKGSVMGIFGVLFVVSLNKLLTIYSCLASELRCINAHMTYCNSRSRRIFIFGDNGLNPINIHMTYLFINQPKMQYLFWRLYCRRN